MPMRLNDTSIASNRQRTVCLLAVLMLVARASADEPAAKDASPATTAAQATEEVTLFDGKSLDGWRIIDTFDFKRHGKVEVRDGEIHLEKGTPSTGISWKGELPRSQYEIKFEGQRVDGSDFFCGLTFPVKEQYCTLILGGWGGQIVGLSNIDSYSAVENETTQVIDFKNGQWYAVVIRVTDEQIEVTIDGKKIIDVKTMGHEFSIWWEQEPVTPLGIVTWNTTGAIRKLELQRINP